jgi:hypothetical protein
VKPYDIPRTQTLELRRSAKAKTTILPVRAQYFGQNKNKQTFYKINKQGELCEMRMRNEDKVVRPRYFAHIEAKNNRWMPRNWRFRITKTQRPPGWYLGLIHFRRQPFVGNAFILFSSSQLKEILDINDVKCPSMLCISTLASTLLVCRFEKNGN